MTAAEDKSLIKLEAPKTTDVFPLAENQFKDATPTFSVVHKSVSGEGTLWKEKNVVASRMLAVGERGMSRIPSPVFYPHPINDCWTAAGNGRYAAANPVGFTFTPGYLQHCNGYMTELDPGNSFFMLRGRGDGVSRCVTSPHRFCGPTD